MQTCAATAQRYDAPGVIRPCVAAGAAPRTTGLSRVALGLNRGRHLSAYGCNRSQTGPSRRRSVLPGLPVDNARPDTVHVPGRRRLDRIPYSPSGASTPVRVRDSGARIRAAERWQARSGRGMNMPRFRAVHTVWQAPSPYPHSEEPKRTRKISSRSVTGACGNPTCTPVQTGTSRLNEARGSSIPSRTWSSGASELGWQAR